MTYNHDISLLDWFRTVYCNKPKMAGGSQRTADLYEIDLNIINSVFRTVAAERDPAAKIRDMRPSDFSGELIERAMRFQKDRDRANSTCNRLRRAALAFWRHAWKKGYHPQPPEDVEKYNEPEHAPTSWSAEELGSIFHAAANMDGRVGRFAASVWFSALLWTIYNGGLRLSATMAIRDEWVSLSQGRLCVPAKVQKDRQEIVVMLKPETVEALKLLRSPEPSPRPGELFGDWPLDRTSHQWKALTLRLRRIIVDAGVRDSIEQVTESDLFHNLRRTFATQMRAAGVDLETIRRWMGHSSASVTLAYIDQSKVDGFSQADKLPSPPKRQLRIAKFE